MAALLWALLGVAAGIGIAVQGPVNAELARGLGVPIAAAAVSFAAGAVVLAIIAAALTPTRATAIAWHAPPAWLFLAGGCLGATYVTSAILLTPRIGATAYVALTIGAQLVAGLLIDRAGFLGVPVHTISAGRLVGAAFLVAGAVMVRLL